MSSASPRDPIAMLQASARRVAAQFVPGSAPQRVVILDAQGHVLFSVAVPPGDVEKAEPREQTPPSGWLAGEKGATFDGKPVRVAASRFRLLAVLVAAEEPLTAKELTERAFDRATDIANTRYHIRELRKELAEAFPSFEGNVIEGDDAGYRLVLR
jgi:DNA-binding response OmpR family regulator